jgi:hypothetical protein
LIILIFGLQNIEFFHAPTSRQHYSLDIQQHHAVEHTEFMAVLAVAYVRDGAIIAEWMFSFTEEICTCSTNTRTSADDNTLE